MRTHVVCVMFVMCVRARVCVCVNDLSGVVSFPPGIRISGMADITNTDSTLIQNHSYMYSCPMQACMYKTA